MVLLLQSLSLGQHDPPRQVLLPVHPAPLPQTQVLLLPQVLPLVQSVSAQHSLQVPLQQCWPEAQQAATDVPLQ